MSYENLSNILSFIEESLLRDQKLIRKLSDYSACVSFHEGEIRELVNVEMNANEMESPAWLKVSRVTKTRPPSFPLSSGTSVDAGEIAASPDWVSVTDDPEHPPSLKTSIRRAVSESAAQTLLRDGKVRRESLYAASSKEANSVAVLLLEDFPEVKLLFDKWLTSAWIPWSNREKPIRKAATFYEELFKIHTAITGRDLPIELVIGIGMVRGLLGGHGVDHPLIEYSVYLEVNPSNADMLIRPKQRSAELFDFETDNLSGDATALRREANSHWGSLPDHIDSSPFERQHWERIVRSAAHYLKDDGKFVEAGPSRRLGIAASDLTVSDTWVLFTRPISARPMISDIRKLKEELVNAQTLEPLMVLLDNPVAAESLQSSLPDRISEMLADAFGRIALGGKANWSAAAGSSTPASEFRRVAPYFPRVSNTEQERIVEILERPETKGLVVQGPPGTGKSHSIANIICHGLARGWRILVTAHSDGPLQVLRDMLPEGVRDLAVNLSTGEQSEVLQLEASVKAISGVPGRVGDKKQRMQQIVQIEQRILDHRQRLDEIRAETLEWARTNLERTNTYAGDLSAGELAEKIVEDRAAHTWLADAIPIANAKPPLSEEEAGRLRQLRAKIGNFLSARDWKLPQLSLLPTTEEILKIHLALQEDYRLSEQENLPIAHLSAIKNGREVAADLLAALHEMSDGLSKIAAHPWIDKYIEDVTKDASNDRFLALSVHQVLELFAPLFEREKAFILSQVVTPTVLQDGLKKCIQNAIASGRPYKDIPFLRPSADVIAALSELRVRGLSPVSPDDWRLLSEHISWREEISRLAKRWNAVSQMFLLEEAPADEFLALSWIKQASLAISTADVLISSVCPQIQKLAASVTAELKNIKPSVAAREAINAKILKLADALALRIAQIDLAWAKENVKAVEHRLHSFHSPYLTAVKGFLGSLGNNVTAKDIEEQWRAIRKGIETESSLFSLVQELDSLVDRIEFSGAPLWAEALRSIPDLSPNFHPVESRIRSSFGPIRSGVATAWGAKPVVERSAPGCCGTEALRAA